MWVELRELNLIQKNRSMEFKRQRKISEIITLWKKGVVLAHNLGAFSEPCHLTLLFRARGATVASLSGYSFPHGEWRAKRKTGGTRVPMPLLRAHPQWHNSFLLNSPAKAPTPPPPHSANWDPSLQCVSFGHSKPKLQQPVFQGWNKVGMSNS